MDSAQCPVLVEEDGVGGVVGPGGGGVRAGGRVRARVDADADVRREGGVGQQRGGARLVIVLGTRGDEGLVQSQSHYFFFIRINKIADASLF